MTTTRAIRMLLDQLYTSPSYRHLFPISINKSQGEFLARLLRQLKPNTLIEIGCGYGLSALWVASVRWPKLHHAIIDPYSKPLPKISALLKNPNFRQMTNKNSQNYLAELDVKNQTVDCFVIDGANHFDACITDLYFANRLLKVNGHLIVRNHWNPAVRKACQFFLRNLSYSLVGVSAREQWLIQKLPPFLLGYTLYKLTDTKTAGFIVLKKTAPDKRVWNHFAKFC